MSSINSFPTFNYSQPEEYHFSHDSVFLARRVFEFVRDKSASPKMALDLCAGCGVIGLDLLFHLRKESLECVQVIDFLEVQEQYLTYFQENLRRLGDIKAECRFINANYSQIKNSDLQATYDLIVCNPPYFSKARGRLPGSDLKLRSRFFVDSDLQTLFEFIYQKLLSNGDAFVLVRDQSDHGYNQLEAVRQLCAEKLKVHILEDVRGTHLVHLSK